MNRPRPILFLATIIYFIFINQPMVQGASDDVLFEARVSEIQGREGFQTQPPDPIFLTNDATILDEASQPLSLNELSDRVFNARDQIRVQVWLNEEGQINKLVVLGQNVSAPSNMEANQKSFTLFFVDSNNRSITQTSIPFVEVTTLDTRIYGKDGVKISLQELQKGSLVEILGAFDGTRFIAQKVKILQSVEHLNFGGVVIEIQRESSTQGKLIFDNRSNYDYVDGRAPILLDGESLGTGYETIANFLRQTSETIKVRLSKREFFPDSQGSWGQVELEIGGVSFGKNYIGGGDRGPDTVTYQIPLDPTLALMDSGDENNPGRFRIRPKQDVFDVDAGTNISLQNNNQDLKLKLADLVEFSYISVMMDKIGEKISNVRLYVGEQPIELTFDSRVTDFDEFTRSLGFHEYDSIELSPGASLFDLQGNPVPSSAFQDLQYQQGQQMVALVTINPSSGKGQEVRLVEMGTNPGPDQVIIGALKGWHRGFWINQYDGKVNLASHGFSSSLTPQTIIRSKDGQEMSEAILNQQVNLQIFGFGVQGTIYLREIIVQTDFQEFEITARVRHINKEGKRIEFEEPPPLQIDPNAEVFDHFGDKATLRYISNLLEEADLKLRLTGGGRTPDGSKAFGRVEAFRPNAEVSIGPDQQLVSGGRIDSYSYPPMIFIQSVQEVNYSNTTEILDASGNTLSAADLENGIRVRVSGNSMERPDNDRYGPKRNYLALRIEKLSGAATEYRGILAEIKENTLIFKEPAPFFVSSQTDIREETGYNIDFLTLAARIHSEGGLRLELGADFSSPGARRVWYARIMHPNEPRRSHMGRDETVAFFIEANEENRTIRSTPVPSIQLTDKTKIISLSGEDLTSDNLIPGARIKVLAETQNNLLVAAELHVEEVPETFEITAPIEYLDSVSRRIHFKMPFFITVAPNAQILDTKGKPIDLEELRKQMMEAQDTNLLRVTQAANSPSDAPIAEVIEILEFKPSLEVGNNQFLAIVEDAAWQIRVREGRIEPTPLPPVEVSPEANIRNLDDNTIELSEIPSGSRVRVMLQEFRGVMTATDLRIVGGHTFTEDAILGKIDLANRLLTPEPEPPIAIDPRAFIGDPFGNRINLTILADFLRRQPNLLLAIQLNPYGPGVQGLYLLDPEKAAHVSPDQNQIIEDGEWIEVDVNNSVLRFKPPPPARVSEDAKIVGPNDETLTLTDLQPGQRIFVRGEELGDDVVITAITAIPKIDEVKVVPQIGDFDEGGVENDVLVEVVTQDDEKISLPLRLFVDFSPPVESRTGHIFTNLSPGPHIVRVEIPSLPDMFGQERVFISARGSAFRVTETSPAADSTGVSLTSDITITFNEPLRQAGDFISVSGSIKPKAVKWNRGELSGDGKTVRYPNVELEEGTDYTLSIVAATSKGGNILSQPFHIQFSTGQSLVQLGSMAGTVNLTSDVQFVGTARLFDEKGEPALEVPLEGNGGFTLNSVFAGTYRLSAEVQAEDGRTISGFLDKNEDGNPDDIILAAGEIKSNLNLTLSLPVIQEPKVGGGENRDALVSIDLDTRNGNQSLDSLKVLPDSEVNVAVYANVVNLIGYNVSFSYDTTAVSFQGIEEGTDAETNLLKLNAGLAVNLPPLVGTSSVEYAGAILGASSLQAVTGEGLLGVFQFRTRKNFSDQTEFLVPRVLLQSQTVGDTVSALARAVLIPSTTRILLTLSADPDTIPADGKTTTAIRAELKDAAGQSITDETQIRFEVTSGSASLSKTEVVTTSGTAQVELSGQAPGNVEVEVKVDGTSEKISVVLQASEAPVPVGEGPVGPIALDLNTDLGDQSQRQTTRTPKSGDNVVIDIVAVSDAQGNGGFQVRLEYDPVQLEWTGFEAKDVFKGAMAIPPSSPNGLVEINVAILGGNASKDSGTLGQTTFKILEGFSGETKITLISASFNKPVEVGSGGATVVIGGETVVEPTPDFNGDGSVDFTDFINFAGVFGAQEGTSKYDPSFDLDSSGDVGFTDFLIFAQAFGKPVSSKPIKLSKPIGYLPGLNQNSKLSLLPSVGDQPDEITVSVQISDAEEIGGYSLKIDYDPSSLVFLDAIGVPGSRFSESSRIPSIQIAPNPGTLLLADLLNPESIPKGNVNLVQLRFRLLDLTLPGRMEILQALLSDQEGRINSIPETHLTELRALPKDYALTQNHPNPFNPETVVPFALPQAGEIHIGVYNVLGQEIAVLIEGYKGAGFHRVVWNGKDLVGRKVSTGVYFVRMVTDRFIDVRKMMLLK